MVLKPSRSTRLLAEELYQDRPCCRAQALLLLKSGNRAAHLGRTSFFEVWTSLQALRHLRLAPALCGLPPAGTDAG